RLIGAFAHDTEPEKRPGRVSRRARSVNTSRPVKLRDPAPSGGGFCRHWGRDLEAGLWARCVRALEDELPEQQFNTWVRPLQVVQGDGALKLLAPNRFVVDWVNAHLLGRIGDLIRDQS